jgi:hypothetical protein
LPKSFKKRDFREEKSVSHHHESKEVNGEIIDCLQDGGNSVASSGSPVYGFRSFSTKASRPSHINLQIPQTTDKIQMLEETKRSYSTLLSVFSLNL